MTELKDPNSFNNQLKDVFAKMSISHKYKIVGSSNLLPTIYTTDYDLNDDFDANTKDEEKVYNRIYEFFLHFFEECRKDVDIYITDLKCGLSGNEPIRWNYNTLSKEKSRFIRSLKQKARVKMDVVYHLNNAFVEVSMVYYIRVGQFSNYTEKEFEKSYIIKELEKDIIKYKKENNLMKVLKRKYSLFKQNVNRIALQNKLLDFFNSPTGIKYKAVSDLKTILLLKEQSFREVPKEELYKFQQIIKQNLNVFELDKIFKLLDKPKLSVKQIDSIITQLIKLINKDCLKDFGFLLNGSI